MHCTTKEVTRVVVTLTLGEAHTLHDVIGNSSLYEREKCFEGLKTNYPSKYPGQNDIFGYLWEALDAAKL